MENKIRTEEEILKDFEKLGWLVGNGFVDFMLQKIEKKPDKIIGEIYHYCYICINKEKHTYSAEDIHCFTTHEYELSMQEHKLLHELFTIWGWLEND